MSLSCLRVLHFTGFQQSIVPQRRNVPFLPAELSGQANVDGAHRAAADGPCRFGSWLPSRRPFSARGSRRGLRSWPEDEGKLIKSPGRCKWLFQKIPFHRLRTAASPRQDRTSIMFRVYEASGTVKQGLTAGGSDDMDPGRVHTCPPVPQDLLLGGITQPTTPSSQESRATNVQS